MELGDIAKKIQRELYILIVLILIASVFTEFSLSAAGPKISMCDPVHRWLITVTILTISLSFILHLFKFVITVRQEEIKIYSKNNQATLNLASATMRENIMGVTFGKNDNNFLEFFITGPDRVLSLCKFYRTLLLFCIAVLTCLIWLQCRFSDPILAYQKPILSSAIGIVYLGLVLYLHKRYFVGRSVKLGKLDASLGLVTQVLGFCGQEGIVKADQQQPDRYTLAETPIYGNKKALFDMVTNGSWFSKHYDTKEFLQNFKRQVAGLRKNIESYETQQKSIQAQKTTLDQIQRKFDILADVEGRLKAIEADTHLTTFLNFYDFIIHENVRNKIARKSIYSIILWNVLMRGTKDVA